MTNQRMKFGTFLAPFHRLGENPTVGLERDLELLQHLDRLDFDEAWIGEHHSGGWETISSPELFIANAAARTKYIKLGTGVISLPYHNPLMVANRMVLLDHLTRGRVMMGVGPGALATDAHMLDIDPLTQREKMDESLGVIMRLLTETAPITHKSDWFSLKDAAIHLKPYTRPYFPISVAAAQSPSGMVLAGKHGTGVLSLGLKSYTVSSESYSNTLKDFWDIAENTAKQHDKEVRRENWRIVIVVHLASSRQKAMEQARMGAAYYQRDYFENTMGFDSVYDGPPEKIIDAMVEKGTWVIGTPDDLIDAIKQLNIETGGFGGLLVQATEFATRDEILNSYELISRYVAPEFQDSLPSLVRSQKWSADLRHELMEKRRRSVKKAGDKYDQSKK